MFNRTFLILAGIAAVFLSVSHYVQGELFIEEKKAIGVILIPGEPTKAEVFAAEELQMFLKKITCVEVPIETIRKNPNQPAIIVGNCPENDNVIKELKDKYPIKPGSWETAGNYDAFAVVGDGNTCRLVGQTESALLYATWDWLESLGIRWIMPGEYGTFVPSAKNIDIPVISKFEAPRLWFRGQVFGMKKSHGFPEYAREPEHGIPADTLYSCRVRLRAFVDKDRSPIIGSGHSYGHYMPPEKYYNDHPDWYFMRDGRRQKDGAWQLCYTNNESPKEFAKNLIKHIKVELKVGVRIERMKICVSPNDGSDVVCECPECTKLLDSDGSATSMVTHYANMVAKEIRNEYPTARVVFYAYTDYTRPGEYVKPDSGVCPELVFWSWVKSVGANSSKPMFSDGNEKYRRYFKQWSKCSDGISSYTYYGHYTWFTPWPFLTQMARDIPIMCNESKFYGMYSEMHLHWGTQSPNFYLYPKLLWNPDVNVAAVMNDFYEKGFGSASLYIKGYYQLLQKKMDRLPYICGYLTEIPVLLTPDVVARCNNYMDQAEKTLGKMDVATRWRTNLVIRSWRISANMAEAMRLYIQPTPQPGDREKIVKLLNDVLAYMETEIGQFAIEKRVAKPEINSILIPLSVPLDNLPKGKTSVSYSLNYGGAVKYLGKVDGFVPGLWGYSLPTHGTGKIDLPVYVRAGRKLAGLTLNLNIDCKEGIGIKISVSAGNDGQRKLIAKGIESCKKEIVVPEELLGERMTLHIQAENWSSDSRIILAGIKMKLVVE